MLCDRCKKNEMLNATGLSNNNKCILLCDKCYEEMKIEYDKFIKKFINCEKA